MAGPSEVQATYISQRSADVILSDIRPVKLNVEALRSINVLLDEFLYNILAAARSLATSQLRAGLNKVLPTTLGKEALLEAEMEMRAYVERTGASNASLAVEEQGKEFNLQWAFELIRLKCQAYSTLSDSDEDPQAEARLAERIGKAIPDVSPPKGTLVAPAALYLTAIIESVCEHVLSNVGKVATRDSSRTTATMQDLFVALCEDDSIYGLFKTMKVYDHIENLTKSTKPRRRSHSRPGDHNRTLSQASSPGQAAPPLLRTRMSSESSLSTAVTKNPGTLDSRSSFDKTRAMKMFTNNRTSSDRGGNGSLHEGRGSHKRSDSVLSDATKQVIAAYEADDASSDAEFDDMMRSGSTMKVSLTPDRLKSMEVYNKEKGLRKRAVRQSDSRNSLRTEEKIVEETPNVKPKPSRSRQSSIVSTPPVSMSATRIRSFSAAMPPQDMNSHARTPFAAKASMLPPPPPPPLPPSLVSTRGRTMPPVSSLSKHATRHTSRNSIDLDDEDSDFAPPSPLRQTAPVSAGARDLIDFLAKGPPDMGPPPIGMLDTPKKSGRLQRMISKLSLKDGDGKRNSNGSPNSSKGSRTAPSIPTSPVYPRPVPPRIIPAPISPPESSDESSLVDQDPTPAPTPARPRKTSSARKAVPIISKPEPPMPVADFAAQTTPKASSSTASRTISKSTTPARSQVNGHVSQTSIKDKDTSRSETPVRPDVPAITVPVSPPERGSSNNAVVDMAKAPEPTSPAKDTAGHARDMHRLMAHATNADECRLLVDMFLIRSGLHPDVASDHQTHYPSPPSDAHQPLPIAVESELEQSLVELFLGSLIDEEEEESFTPGSTTIASFTPGSCSDSDAKPVTLPVSPPDTPLAHVCSSDVPPEGYRKPYSAGALGAHPSGPVPPGVHNPSQKVYIPNDLVTTLAESSDTTVPASIRI
ncbi:hypothetical protein FIBSPDRAFT_897397 [Athelia psychrophila]|uniref:Uncharacterized protein n=1 Tax=Athelia psychrophila TaxID=1759441 RepID=A0A166CBG4_9AGAM|nr:hypothetical protein FIBSPDRAFT_897397 [Fibularhizoctonia sp. CBS 109695]